MSDLPPSTAAAYRVAKEAFEKMDATDACRRTGASFDGNCYTLPYLGQEARVNAQTLDVMWERPERTSHMDDMILWHYLMHADGAEPTGEKLSAHDAAPSTSGWVARMLKTCIPPLAQAFGEDLPAFFESAAKMGGNPVSEDTAELCVLPHLPLYLTIWVKDDEFPADARIMFDTSLHRQLPQEDILVLPELAVYDLLTLSGKPFNMPGVGEFRPGTVR